MDIFLNPDLKYINIYLILFAITFGLFMIVGVKRKKDYAKEERQSSKIKYIYWLLLALIIFETFYYFIIPAYNYAG
jgi:hypothetical protein